VRVRGVLPSLLAVLLIGACSGARAEPPRPRVAVTVRVTTVEVGPKELVVMNEVFREATFDPVGTLTDEDAPTHDQNGNRIAEDDLRLVFDAFDRLIRVVRRADGETIGRYRYDAFGRRVERVFEDPATGLTEEVLYVSDGAQEIEELDGQGNLRADYVYGARYVDEVCQIRRPDGAGGFEELYLHQSSIFTVHAVTDASGAVVERYRYGSIYGAVTVTDGGGGARAPPDEVGNPWRFQGRRLDAETGFYFFRARYYDPYAGRFLQRDPIYDAANLGNQYTFVANDPVDRMDPFGLDGATDHALTERVTGDIVNWENMTLTPYADRIEVMSKYAIDAGGNEELYEQAKARLERAFELINRNAPTIDCGGRRIGFTFRVNVSPTAAPDRFLIRTVPTPNDLPIGSPPPEWDPRYTDPDERQEAWEEWVTTARATGEGSEIGVNVPGYIAASEPAGTWAHEVFHRWWITHDSTEGGLLNPRTDTGVVRREYYTYITYLAQATSYEDAKARHTLIGLATTEGTPTNATKDSEGYLNLPHGGGRLVTPEVLGSDFVEYGAGTEEGREALDAFRIHISNY